ncbi:MAG: enoyl-CoA hydratase-related protein [Halioglobus sp.]
MSTLIQYQSEDGIATLTINRAEKRNALNNTMWQAISDALTQASADNTVKALILTGAGQQAFCGGADIAELADNMKNPERQQQSNVLIQRVQAELEEFSKPTIAAIRGACFGGGCGLALACDFRFASPDSQFAITPAKLGLLYSLRDTRRLYNLVGLALSRELLYTAKPINAERALNTGLVDRLVEGDSLMATASEFAHTLSHNSPQSLRGIKTTLAHLQGLPAPDEAGLAQLFDEAFGSEDFSEGSQAFLSKRAPQFND